MTQQSNLERDDKRNYTLDTSSDTSLRATLLAVSVVGRGWRARAVGAIATVIISSTCLLSSLHLRKNSRAVEAQHTADPAGRLNQLTSIH